MKTFERCEAKTRYLGDDHPCRNPAGMRTDHLGYGRCYLHGGRSPGAKKAAEKAQAAELVVTFGLPREIDPVDALLEEIYRTCGHIDYVLSVIQALDPDALVWGTREITETAGIIKGVEEASGTRTDGAAVNVWLDLYRGERKHYVDVCKAAIGAGIEERRINLAEQQGKLAAEAIRAILNGLGLTAEQRAKVPELTKTHFALIQGGVA